MPEPDRGQRPLPQEARSQKQALVLVLHRKAIRQPVPSVSLSGAGNAPPGIWFSARQWAIRPGSRPVAKITVNMFARIPIARSGMPLCQPTFG